MCLDWFYAEVRCRPLKFAPVGVRNWCQPSTGTLTVPWPSSGAFAKTVLDDQTASLRAGPPPGGSGPFHCVSMVAPRAPTMLTK